MRPAVGQYLLPGSQANERSLARNTPVPKRWWLSDKVGVLKQRARLGSERAMSVAPLPL